MAYTPLNPTAGPGLLPLTYTRASAFPVDVLRDGRILFEAGFPLGNGIDCRSCIWFTPMARVLSRCAAITGARAGAERSWLRATWFLRMAHRWRVLLRRWRMRSLSRRREAFTQARLPRPHPERGCLARGQRQLRGTRSGCGCLAHRIMQTVLDSKRRGSGRACVPCAACAAQSASLGAAPVGICESAGARFACFTRWRFEGHTRFSST